MDLKITTRKRTKDSKPIYTLRCTNPKCQKFHSLFVNSFFGLFQKPFWLMVELIKCWCIQMSISKAVDKLRIDDLSIDRHVVGKLYRMLRNVCCASISKSFEKLGGTGQIVEIDESLVAKIKYNRGSGLKRKQVQIFGLVERSEKGKEGRCYITIVKNRKAETLLPIIYDHVQHGSLIVSDSWSSYNKLSRLNYKHETVNHSVSFLNNKGFHTNTISSDHNFTSRSQNL